MLLCTWCRPRSRAQRRSVAPREMHACVLCGPSSAYGVAGAVVQCQPSDASLRASQALMASVSATNLAGYAPARADPRVQCVPAAWCLAAVSQRCRRGTCGPLACSPGPVLARAVTSMHPRRSNLALRGGGFSLAKPGTLKAAAKTEVPDWYRGTAANGGQLATLLVCKSCRALSQQCFGELAAIGGGTPVPVTLPPVYALRFLGRPPQPRAGCAVFVVCCCICVLTTVDHARCHSYRATRSSRAWLPWV